MSVAVLDQLSTIKERVSRAAQRSGRSPSAISLLVVTKTVPVERVRPVIEAGVLHIGENRVQDALAKYGDAAGRKVLPDAIQLHLIGHLQSNKAKKAANLFDVIQSLDSTELANDLNRHAQEQNRVLPCLVEVKISPEATKFGMEPEKVEDFIAGAGCWPFLKIKGFMGIAPYSKNAEDARPFFATLRKLFEKTKLEILSMGMSGDYEVAIEEGSTMVRLGTALFGERA